MAVVEELIRIEENGTISFGNYKLEEKSKKSDFEFKGDLYKVKTCKEITKLERNGLFVYESVPGTAVNSFKVENGGVSFEVESDQNAQITVELEESTEYVMYLDGVNALTDRGLTSVWCRNAKVFTNADNLNLRLLDTGIEAGYEIQFVN